MLAQLVMLPSQATAVTMNFVTHASMRSVLQLCCYSDDNSKQQLITVLTNQLTQLAQLHVFSCVSSQ